MDAYYIPYAETRHERDDCLFPFNYFFFSAELFSLPC